MPNRRYTITPDTTHSICAYIRQGGFPDVAAEAAGIPVEIFRQWLAKGQATKAREPYRSFASEVRQAIAQGRIMAEMQVQKKDPRFWLADFPDARIALAQALKGEW